MGDKKVEINDSPGEHPKATVKIEDRDPGCGVDIGTMNIVVARQIKDKVETRSMRDAFLEFDKSSDIEQMIKFQKAEYYEEGEKIFLLGESAMSLSNIVGQEVSRPLSKGTINPGEIRAAQILARILYYLLGDPVVEDEPCRYSVPAPSVDIDNDIIFHKGVFREILEKFGYKASAVNEAMAIVYSECVDEDFSGLALSFGAGMTNCALAWGGIEGLSFSVARGGDWIDQSVARSVNSTASRIAKLKEGDLNLKNYEEGDEKNLQVRRALCFYFEDHISYVLKQIAFRVKTQASSFELPKPIPIVVSGGVSKAKGFMEWFVGEFEEKYRKDFPVDVSEVRQARNPLTAVAEGLLVSARM